MPGGGKNLLGGGGDSGGEACSTTTSTKEPATVSNPVTPMDFSLSASPPILPGFVCISLLNCSLGNGLALRKSILTSNRTPPPPGISTGFSKRILAACAEDDVASAWMTVSMSICPFIMSSLRPVSESVADPSPVIAPSGAVAGAGLPDPPPVIVPSGAGAGTGLPDPSVVG